MKQTVALVTLLLLLTGFAYAAPPENCATVHLYRNRTGVAMLWKYKIKINGKKVKVKNNYCYDIKVPSGNTHFQVTTAGHDNMYLDLEPGKEYYVKSYLRAGLFCNKVEIVPVPETFAKTQLAKIKQGHTRELTL